MLGKAECDYKQCRFHRKWKGWQLYTSLHYVGCMNCFYSRCNDTNWTTVIMCWQEMSCKQTPMVYLLLKPMNTKRQIIKNDNAFQITP